MISRQSVAGILRSARPRPSLFAGRQHHTRSVRWEQTFTAQEGEWRRSSRHFWSPFVSFVGERARRARIRPVLMLALALTHPSRLGAHAIRRVRGEWNASDRLPTRPADQQGPKRRPTTTTRQRTASFPRARSGRPARGSEIRARPVARACSYPCGPLRGSWVLRNGHAVLRTMLPASTPRRHLPTGRVKRCPTPGLNGAWRRTTTTAFSCIQLLAQ